MKVVLFDLDGTLVDTQILYNRAISRSLLKYSPEYTLEYCSNYFEGRCWKDAISDIASKEGFNPTDVFNEALAYAQELISTQAKPTEGTVEALTMLCLKGVKFAICSNSHFNEIVFALKKAGLLGFFERENFFGRDSVENGKPDPEIYQKALKHFGVLPKNAFVLEDSLNGARASIGAGIPTCIFTGSSSFSNMEKFDEVFGRRLMNVSSVKEFAQMVLL